MASDDEGVENTQRTVHAATVKLPKFYALAPAFWFAQAESQFRIKRITEEVTKFDHVVASLTEEVAMRVMPAIVSMDYARLRKDLMGAFDLTVTQRAAKLLHLPGLGDKRPSMLAAEIVALVPEGLAPGYLERQIFLEQLPASVQQNMAAHEGEKDLVALAALADGYVAAARTRAAVSYAVAPPPFPPYAGLPQEMADGPAECAAVGGNSRPSNGGKLCFYHRKWGVTARRCLGGGCQWRSRPAPSVTQGNRSSAFSGNANASRQ